MDLSRQLKNAIATGNLLFGQRQANDACAKGEAKLVLVAANCPEEYTDALRASHPEVTMYRAAMVNRDSVSPVVSLSQCLPSPSLTLVTVIC